jgi:Type VI secretion system, TssC, VipB
MAIAGKMYSEKVSQPIMGEMNGSVSGSAGLAFHTVQDTVADLSDEGMNSMMHAYEKDMAYEACTAFTGAEYALKRYSVVRTFDYVNRVMRHYLGKVTGQQLDREKANFVRDTIQDFLDQLAEQKIITSGKVTQFDWNKNVPDRIDIDISIVPLWAVRTFVYALKAQNKKASADLKETK